jgi:chitodextrinase
VWFILDGVAVSTIIAPPNPCSYDWPITADNNGIYTWMATAFDERGNSFTTVPVAVRVDIDVTPPLAPASLTGSAVSSTSVHLDWTPATDNVGVTGYHVQRGGSLIATLAGDVTAYTDTGLQPKTQYRYAVSAFDAHGNESVPSPERIVTTPHPPLVSPSGYIFNITAQSAEVRWTPVPDATHYTVAASLSKEGGTFPIQQEATESPNSLSGLAPNTTYYLFANACDETCTELAFVNSVVTHANVPGLSVPFVRGREVQLTIDPKGNPKSTVYQVEVSHAWGHSSQR